MFFNVANASESSQATSMDPLMQFLPFILIFIVFYFLLIRPEKKRQQKHKEMLSQINKSDKIVTSGGIIGKVSSVKDDVMVVEISSDVEVEIMRNSVVDVIDSKTKKSEKK